MNDAGALLALAATCAREAGTALLEAFGSSGLQTHTKSTATDPVSEADFAAEKLIRNRIAAERPDDAVIGEESGESSGSGELRWIVDPLDGTVNFLYGIPAWCVSIACADAEQVIAGVVFDPVRDELWSATVGEPARLNGVVIEPSGATDMAMSLVATGFAYDSSVRSEQAAVIAGLLPRVRDIRRAGSAALDLVWTAGGRLDGYFERSTQLWDVAAGELICRSAGLEVRQLPAREDLPSGSLTGHPELVEALWPHVR